MTGILNGLGNLKDTFSGSKKICNNNENDVKAKTVYSKKIEKEISFEKLPPCNTIDVIGNAHTIVKKVLAELNSAVSENGEFSNNLSRLINSLGEQASQWLIGPQEEGQLAGLAPGAVHALQKGVEAWVIDWCGKANVKEGEPIATLINQAFENAAESVVKGAAKGLEAAIMRALEGEVERIAEDASSENIIVQEQPPRYSSKTVAEAINRALNDILKSNITCTAQAVSKVFFGRDVTSDKKGIAGAIQKHIINPPLKRMEEMVKPFSESLEKFTMTLEDLNKENITSAVHSLAEIAKSVEETRLRINEELPKVTASIERFGFLAEAITRMLNAISDFFAAIFFKKNRESA